MGLSGQIYKYRKYWQFRVVFRGVGHRRGDSRHRTRRAPQTGLPAPASTSSIVRLSQMNIKGLLFRCCGPSSTSPRSRVALRQGATCLSTCNRWSWRVRATAALSSEATATLLLVRGRHSMGAFSNRSLGFAWVGDASDAGVHGACPSPARFTMKGTRSSQPQAIPRASRISCAASLMAVA